MVSLVWGAMIDAMPSAPLSPLGLTACSSHAFGQRSGFPTNAILISDPEIVACVCQPQYRVQKPDVSLTSEEVRTKKTPFASLGSTRLLIAWATTAVTPASLGVVPRE